MAPHNDASVDPFDSLPHLPSLKPRARSNSIGMDTDDGTSGRLTGGVPSHFDPLPPINSGHLGMSPNSRSSMLREGSLPTLPGLGNYTGLPGSSNNPLGRSLPNSGGSGLGSSSSSSSSSPFSPADSEPYPGFDPQASHASRGIRKFSKRATFSQAQLDIMEDLWAKTEYPSIDQIDRCAEATGLVSLVCKLVTVRRLTFLVGTYRHLSRYGHGKRLTDTHIPLSTTAC